jgi:dipeptidyl aminopeptidase/acylaminoacyl peptidase
MGRSSGGYLALMLATGEGEEGDGSACPRASSSVSIVISEAGPTNLDPLLWEGTWRGNALQGYFGDADPRALSPAMRITATTPPALLFHGTSDTTVPYTQSRLFEAGMHAANRPVRMVSFPNTEHDPLTFHWARGQREILHWVSEAWPTHAINEGN